MKESDIQSQIMRALTEHHAVVWVMVTTTGKVQGRGGHWMTLGVPGLPDIIGQLSDGTSFGIECKLPNKKPTAEQQEFLDLCNANGGRYGVASSVGQALWILEM